MRKILCILFLCAVSMTAVAHAGNAHIWKTGQTTSIRAGDDGDLKRGVAWPSPRFTVEGECVTDNLTGLMWAKNANLPNGTRTWQQALDFANGLTLCGHSDWRLPNRKELMSLVDRSQYNPALPSDHRFDNVQADFYWSSTTNAYYTDYAWLVYMWYGYVNDYIKSNVYYVWPVRLGQVGNSGISPVISMVPASGPPGTTFTLTGTGFTANSTATLHFKKPDGTEYPTQTVATDGSGNFTYAYATPATQGAGTYAWWAVDGATGVRSNEKTYDTNLAVSLRDRYVPFATVKGAVADGVSRVIIQIDNVPTGATVDSIQITVPEGNGSLSSDKSIVNGVFRQTYVAPPSYVRPGHGEDLTGNGRDAGLTVTLGQQTARPALTLVKPPVVLIHGIWSDDSTWKNFREKLVNQYGYPEKFVVAYRYANSVSFDTNKEVVGLAIQKALSQVWQEGYVARKADVVGHSMGGLLAKLYGKENEIRSLTTVGTPHFGSPLASWLYVLTADRDSIISNFIAKRLGARGKPVRNGAVQDLILNGTHTCSHQNCKIGVPNYVIVGVASPHVPSEETRTFLPYTKLTFELPRNAAIEDVATFFFGTEANDWIVGVTSQHGHWVGEEVAVGSHTTETGDGAVHDKIVAFLNGQRQPSSLKAGESPAPLAIRSSLAVTAQGKTPLSGGGNVTITSPPDQQAFHPGDSVTVAIDVVGDDPIVLVDTSTGASALLVSPPYTYQFAIPQDQVQPVTVTVGAADAGGFIGTHSVTLTVTTAVHSTGLRLIPDGPLDLPAGMVFPLSLVASYDDGMERPVLSDALFQSSAPGILEVTEEGVLVAKGQGVAIVSAQYGALSALLTVTVTARKLSIPLEPGWNFISLPRHPTVPAIGTVLQDVLSDVGIVWGYDNIQKLWRKYRPDDPSSTLDTMEGGKGYWIFMNAPGVLTTTVTDAPVTVTLTPGWNLVGYAGMDRKFIASSLSLLSGKWEALWNWNDNTWSLAHPTLQSLPVPTLSILNQNRAYWIRIKQGQGPVEWVQ